MYKIIITSLFGLSLLCNTSLLVALAQTKEEKELKALAAEQKDKITQQELKALINGVKDGWALLAKSIELIKFNREIEKKLIATWKKNYSPKVDVTEKIRYEDLKALFETYVIYYHPSVDLNAALYTFNKDAYAFKWDFKQTDFRETIAKASKIIIASVMHYTPDIKKHAMLEESTLYLQGILEGKTISFLTTQQQKALKKNTISFLREKIKRYNATMYSQHYYCSEIEYQTFMFSLLQTLIFDECPICMNEKTNTYTICCLQRAHSNCLAESLKHSPLCPFCNAH